MMEPTMLSPCMVEGGYPHAIPINRSKKVNHANFSYPHFSSRLANFESDSLAEQVNPEKWSTFESLLGLKMDQRRNV